MGIFISYARADDEPFVRRLHEDLDARGFSVWWDRKAMESRGRTFLQELRDAIAEVERVLLVIGPKAIESEYVRAEWQFALESCKVVVPILRLGDVSLVPADVRRLHCPDFRSDDRYAGALDELSRILSSDLPPLAEPAGVNELPPNFLPRPDLIEQLRQTVLADLHDPNVDRAKRATALVGMGGVGKSVLAAAFARACETRRAMGDGIHWLKFGREADAQANLRRLAAKIGERSTAIRDLDVVKTRIAERLSGQRCLIVLDDVSDPAHAAAFRGALGSRCRLLITSRDRKLAIDLGAHLVPVDTLDDESALELLARWANHPLEKLPAEAPAIVDECGKLPLAIAMIGATLAGNARRWKHVLQKLRSADLERIEGNVPDYDYPNLLKAIEVSVESLKPRTRARYADLAVFPEDAAVPESVVGMVWEVEPNDAAEMLDELVDRSLASRDAEGHITIHDLLLDYVRAQTADRVALHERLLEKYAKPCKGDWTKGPSDDYFFEHLAHHLSETGRAAELVSLLTKSPAWMNKKQQLLGSHQSLLADIDKALARSTDLLTHAKLAAVRAIAQLQTESHSDHVLQALVWLDRPDEALENARLAASAVERFDALFAIYMAIEEKKGTTPRSVRDEMFRTAQSITADEAKTDAFRDLGVLLAKRNDERFARAFRESRDAAKGIPRHWDRILKLCLLAGSITDSPGLTREELLDEAWTLIEPILADAESDNVQMEVALALVAAGNADRAHAVIAGMTHEGWKLNARMYLPNAYAEADRIEEARAGLVPGSQTEQLTLPAWVNALIRANRFDEALEAARRIQSQSGRAKALGNLAKALTAAGRRGSKSALTEAWKMANRVKRFSVKVVALCCVAEDMAECNDPRSRRVFADAVSTVAEEPGEADRAAAEYDLVLTLTRLSRLDDALQTARAIELEGWRASALGIVALSLARTRDRRAAGVVHESITAATAATDDRSEDSILGALAWYLAQEQCRGAAWIAARSISDEHARLEALTALGHVMAAAKDKRARDVLSEAIAILPRRGYQPDRAQSLRDLAVALTIAGDRRAGAMVTRAAEMARRTERDGEAHGMLTELAGALHRAGSPRAGAMVQEVERTARQEEDRGSKAIALKELALEIRSAELLHDARRAVALRGRILDRDALYRVTEGYATLGKWDEALPLLDRLEEGWSKDDLRQHIVERLSGAERWDEAWSLADVMRDTSSRAESLVNLAIAMARAKSEDTGRAVDAAIAALEAMKPGPLKTLLQSELVLPLVLIGDERTDAFFAEASAGDPEGANWSGIKAAAFAEAGQLSRALALYQPSGTEAFFHTMMSWAGLFNRHTPELGLQVVREAAHILGWVRGDWQAVYTGILSNPECTSPTRRSSYCDPIPTRNQDTAIFKR